MIDASNNGSVPEGREKTTRQTPEKMGRLSESISADSGAGIPLVNRGQGPAKMENVGIRADRLNTDHTVTVTVIGSDETICRIMVVLKMFSVVTSENAICVIQKVLQNTEICTE